MGSWCVSSVSVLPGGGGVRLGFYAWFCFGCCAVFREGSGEGVRCWGGVLFLLLLLVTGRVFAVAALSCCGVETPGDLVC